MIGNTGIIPDLKKHAQKDYENNLLLFERVRCDIDSIVRARDNTRTEINAIESALCSLQSERKQLSQEVEKNDKEIQGLRDTISKMEEQIEPFRITYLAMLEEGSNSAQKFYEKFIGAQKMEIEELTQKIHEISNSSSLYYIDSFDSEIDEKQEKLYELNESLELRIVNEITYSNP